MEGKKKAAMKRYKTISLTRLVVLAAVTAIGLVMLNGNAIPAQQADVGNLEVTVDLEGAKDFRSLTIYVKDRSETLKKGDKSRLFENLPAGGCVVTADAEVSQGWFKPSLRYLGVEPAGVVKGKTEKMTVTLRPVDDIDRFCLECHPEGRVPTRRGQILRDAHTSGKILGDRYLPQVEKYNRKVADQEKGAVEKYFPIRLDEREVDVNGRKVKRLFYTCESCHTLHLETPFTSNAVAPFRNRADLCVGCHY